MATLDELLIQMKEDLDKGNFDGVVKASAQVTAIKEAEAKAEKAKKAAELKAKVEAQVAVEALLRAKYDAILARFREPFGKFMQRGDVSGALADLNAAYLADYPDITARVITIGIPLDNPQAMDVRYGTPVVVKPKRERVASDSDGKAGKTLEETGYKLDDLFETFATDEEKAKKAEIEAKAEADMALAVTQEEKDKVTRAKGNASYHLKGTVKGRVIADGLVKKEVVDA